ncbi:MAG: YceI family protein [Bacteroidota bacterium]|nr:YceI family protein [Bacteroidota bacterium]
MSNNTEILEQSVAQQSSVGSKTVTWKTDPAHSNVQFSIRHMVIAEVTGKFKEFDAALIQHSGDFSGSEISATIKAASITTENADRDKHLASPDFFDVEQYPELSFVSRSFDKVDNDRYVVKGDLTIHGVTKPVEIRTIFFGQAVDPWGNLRAGFKGTTSINRFDFGLQWNQTIETGGLLVGKTADITLNLEFIRQK